MSFFRKFLIALLVLVIILGFWLWWNRPQRVDMAGYVPADSLIYLEANNLPLIASEVTQTDAWKALAPPAGIKANLGSYGWLSRLAAWTGIGPADAVVLSRAQIAVTVMGFDAAEAGATLKIKPRYALVAETHTSASRVQTAIDKRVGEFARRAYGEPVIERKEVGGVELKTWRAAEGERRIVTSVFESVAIVGTDEATVLACVAVRRGERPSLAGNQQMEAMRQRLDGANALAFGYVSAGGAAKLLEVAATVYATQMLSDPRAQGLAASTLPGLANKILGSAGWSARLSNGMVEDRYFVTLQNGVTSVLREMLATAGGPAPSAGELLPAETYSVSHYNYRDPAAAWRGLNLALSTQLDTLGAIFVSQLLKEALKPYGIEEPDVFLRSIGPNIITARLNEPDATANNQKPESGSSSVTVTIVEVKDEKVLREFVLKRLGAQPRRERVGEAEMLVSQNKERGAACFIMGRLLMGPTQHVRRCLEAQGRGETLAAAADFQKAARAIEGQAAANTVTYSSDAAPAHAFISAIAAQKAVREGEPNAIELSRALENLSFSASETRLVENGFEKKTRSSFGQFGTLAAQFSPSSQP
ncbi:MAG: hypothetical protein QOF02_1335 [Blastocatellia bacterium]|jgi:hypothetical protein|nr:hypothetical protein [Blastocatellia bacterium]